MKPIFHFFESRLYPYPDEHIPMPRKGLFKFLWACTKGLRGWLILFMVLTAGVGVYEAMLFAWVGDLVDWMGRYRPDELWATKGQQLTLMMWVLVISPIWIGMRSLIHFQVLQGVFPMQMRWRFHRHMLGQSMQFYHDEFSGRVSAKVMQTALAVRETVMTVGDMLMYVIVYFVTSGMILFALDKLMLIPFILWLVMFSFTLWYFIPKLRDAAGRQADARSLMTGRITDAYANIMTVKLFSHSHRELTYAKNAMEQFMVTVHGQMRWVTVLALVNHITSVVLVGSTAVISVYLWHQSILTVGAIAAATAMAIRLNGLTHWIMWQTAALFEHIGTVQDGIRTLSTPHSVVDKTDALALQVTRGDITFKQLYFTYQTPKKIEQVDKTVTSTNVTDNTAYLLNDFNLTIKSGEKVGLVGRSGSGKSTLVNLLLRFYDVQSGQICIDGQAINAVTQESLRQQIGMVTQDTALLHRSIRENIAYGQPKATDEQIIHAAKQAHAWEFIEGLQDTNGNTALDTQVGERGVKLSGGQRQRIAIARVMLKNAPILLLDEATSALDSEIEHAITESLHDMMAGKTVIAIAHRLSTIAALDKLVVMDNGQIVEQGSHDELLAQDGIYAKLWARQSGGFLGE